MRPNVPWLTLSLTSGLSGVHVFADKLRPYLWLDLERSTELWRIITAHWVHTDLQHALWNGVAFLILGTWIERFSKTTLLVGLSLGMLGVSLWFFSVNTLPLYVGLSGAMNTLLVIALVLAVRDAIRMNDLILTTLITLVGVGAVIKVLTELLFNMSWVDVGVWPSAPGAHAAGLIVGLIWIGLAGSKTMWTLNNKDNCWKFQKHSV